MRSRDVKLTMLEKCAATIKAVRVLFLKDEFFRGYVVGCMLAFTVVFLAFLYVADDTPIIAVCMAAFITTVVGLTILLSIACLISAAFYILHIRDLMKKGLRYTTEDLINEVYVYIVDRKDYLASFIEDQIKLKQDAILNNTDKELEDVIFKE